MQGPELKYDGTRNARPELLLDHLTRPDWTVAQPRPDSALWLDKNENLDPVLAAENQKLVAAVLQKNLCTYPDLAPTYAKLAAYLDVPPNHLLFTAGSDGAIRSVFETLIQPGDKVIHTAPTFAMYPVYCKIFGAEAIPLAYRAGKNGPELTMAEITEAVRSHRPQLLCLPNPDSPTGTVHGEASLRELLSAAANAGTVVLIDEAYHPFYRPTALPWVRECGHLVVARTFAKAWGLAGLRVGYLAASPALAKLFHKVRPMYEVNTLAVAAVHAALDHAKGMEASVTRLLEGKRLFLDRMNALGFRTLRGEGNFLHVAFGGKAQAVHQALAGKVLYRKDFAEPCLAGFSRFSAAPADTMARVAAMIEEASRD